jgi:hypothetical protein
LEHLFDENLSGIFLVFPPNVGVKHFGWNKMEWCEWWVCVVWSLF